MSDSHPIIHTSDLQWNEQIHSESYHLRRKALSQLAGNQKLGCSLYELPPNCKAWPYHYHYANEEAIFILEGTGMIRLNGEELLVCQGDYIALPASSQSAHQMINNSPENLRYLCFSTMIEPDIVAYPDSDKIGVFAGTAPGGSKEQRTLTQFFQNHDQTDYWQGEE